MHKFDTCKINRGRLNRPISCSNEENSILPEFEPFAEATPRGIPNGDTLSVISINMYNSVNMLAHHTNAYQNNNMVIRRGQEFTMGIVFSRPFDAQKDNFFIEFLIGNNPIDTQSTLIKVSPGGQNQTDPWANRVVGSTDNETKVAITPAADCIIGLYSTYVTVVTNTGQQRTQRNQDTDFYVLYNPWAANDQVYLENENERQEYVLNDVGMIYNGDYANVITRPWNYGQFQSGILDACIFILDFGKMPITYRGDAIKVARKGSAMLNSLDDNGVLEGNWGDDFSLGTAPTAWTGSIEILRQYHSAGGVPVKYAQCWVYAGVFLTFLRCLGFPARLITNYCSAHDNGGNLKTDIVLDEDGSLDKMASDTIWNFHCWNEVYCKRADLPVTYSGWQAVDSTPQEISEGYYRCGPVSVAAIKDANLSYSYDAGFVFSEVNSIVVYYKKDKYGNRNIISQDSNYVGKLVLTKMIGSNDQNDITATYKSTKQVARRAAGKKSKDVLLKIQVMKNNNDVMLTMTFANLSNESRTISGKVTGKVEYYTGATRTQFVFITYEVALQPLETKQEIKTITAAEYKNFIIGQSFLCFIIYAFIQETTTYLTARESIHMKPPSLHLELSGHPQVGKEMFANMAFTNALSYDLTNVTVRLEGIGLFPLKTKRYSTIQQGSKIKWIESFTLREAGKKTLVACLDCPAMRNVCGYIETVIHPEHH